MKRIILGDTHGRSFWKLILNTQEWDEAVFIGDYFDSRGTFTGIEELHNFNEICEYKSKSTKPIIMLIGNHDECYINGFAAITGYQHNVASDIAYALRSNSGKLQMAYYADSMLFTHAGVGETWLKKHFQEERDVATYHPDIAARINALWKTDPKAFTFDGWDSSGDSIGQTPIWIRPSSLIRDSKNIKAAGITQIVGHTNMKRMNIQLFKEQKYFFIDTLGTSGEYLIVENGEFRTEKVN